MEGSGLDVFWWGARRDGSLKGSRVDTFEALRLEWGGGMKALRHEVFDGLRDDELKDLRTRVGIGRFVGWLFGVCSLAVWFPGALLSPPPPPPKT